MELGEDCQDRKLPYVDSQYECISSTNFIKTFYPTYEFKKEVIESSQPKGCYVYFNGDSFEGYYNLHKSGSGHSKSKAVCKFAGMCSNCTNSVLDVIQFIVV